MASLVEHIKKVVVADVRLFFRLFAAPITGYIDVIRDELKKPPVL
jgi:hypothetical protein